MCVAELRCAVWNWSRKWRRIRSSPKRCRLSPRSTTNLSNPSSRDRRRAAPSARMSSTTPCLVSWQVIAHAQDDAGDSVTSSRSHQPALSFTHRTLEYFYPPVNVFGMFLPLLKRDVSASVAWLCWNNLTAFHVNECVWCGLPAWCRNVMMLSYKTENLTLIY